MAEFVRRQAKQQIESALFGFCEELLKQLDAFQEHLLFNKQKLLSSMTDIQQAYADYTHQRNIGHVFVLWVTVRKLEAMNEQLIWLHLFVSNWVTQSD